MYRSYYGMAVVDAVLVVVVEMKEKRFDCWLYY